MKYLYLKVGTVGLFFAGSVLLVCYLLSIRYHGPLPMVLFWVAIGLMLGTIVYQCLQTKLSTRYARTVLLEIMITSVLFHLIYQIPYYALRGWDAYMDMASAQGILNSNFILGDPEYVNETSYWPMIHILGTQLSLITNIEIADIVKWLPSFLSIALVPLLYLLMRSVFKHQRVALLSVLLFVILQHNILFGSLFVRETIALVLAVCSLYLYFSAEQSAQPRTYRALSFMCLMLVAVAHHLTAFMLLIFIFIHFIVARVSKGAFRIPSLKRMYARNNLAGENIIGTFLLISFVAFFGYCAYVAIQPLATLTTFGEDLVAVESWGEDTYAQSAEVTASDIRTIRGYIIFLGFYSFHALWGCVLAYKLLPRARPKRLETYSFTLFLFFCGLVGLISMFLVEAEAFPDRYLMFGWLFAFAPLVLATLKTKPKWIRPAGIFLLIIFMLLNVYMIERTTWDPKANEEQVAMATSEEDYALANTFDFSDGTITAHQNNRLAIYHVHNHLPLDDLPLPTDFDWIIMQKKLMAWEERFHAEPTTEAEAQWQQLEQSGRVGHNKIYESSNLALFRNQR